jgi:hypothetical protein
MSSETDLSRNQAIQNQRNSFLREVPLTFNVETLQAFGAIFQIPHYYRKLLHCKSKMLCNYVVISNTTRGYEIAGNFRSHYTSICFDDNFHE